VGHVVTRLGVVIAKAVVVEAGLGIFVLVLVAKGAGRPHAFEVAQLAVAAELGAPGAGAALVDQLQGRAQVVGEDAVALGSC
jgi:hypothetical protein